MSHPFQKIKVVKKKANTGGGGADKCIHPHIMNYNLAVVPLLIFPRIPFCPVPVVLNRNFMFCRARNTQPLWDIAR